MRGKIKERRKNEWGINSKKEERKNEGKIKERRKNEWGKKIKERRKN